MIFARVYFGLITIKGTLKCAVLSSKKTFISNLTTDFTWHNARQRYTKKHSLPSARYSANQDSSMRRTLQRDRRHQRWAFASSSQLRQGTALRPRAQRGRHAHTWASLRGFLTVCAKILCKPTIASAVWVTGLRQRTAEERLQRSWAGVVNEAGWCTAKFYETTLEMAHSSDMSFQLIYILYNVYLHLFHNCILSSLICKKKVTINNIFLSSARETEI